MNWNNYSEKFNKLNDQQKEAVNSLEGPVMVIAGAGTGKTRVIGFRIAQILKETDLNPSNILCMTFTEAGVSAMINSLLDIIGPEAYKVKICTFHAFCNEVISAHPELFPDVNKDAEPLNDIEKIQILLEIIKDLPPHSFLKPFSKTDHYLKSCQSLIEKLKREYVHPEKFLAESEKNEKYFLATNIDFANLKAIKAKDLRISDIESIVKLLNDKGFGDFEYTKAVAEKLLEYKKNVDDFGVKEAKKMLTSLRREITSKYSSTFNKPVIGRQKDFAIVYGNYQKCLRALKKYDYEDMIMFVADAFRDNKDLLNEYQERYQYILIDEYQDTNSVQNETIFQLGNFFPNPNIFVVGDDDQSIYKFQGANTQNIFSFKEKYQDYLKIITLKNNYRSHQLILDAAASVIENNETRITKLIDGLDKNLLARTDLKDIERPLEVNEFLTQDQEAFELVNQVKSLLDNKVDPKQIAILGRSNDDVKFYKEALKKAGIPASKDDGENIYDSPRIKQLIRLMNVITEPENEEALFIVMNYDFLGLKGSDLIKLNQFARKVRKSFSDVVLDEKSELKGFAAKIFSWRERMFNSSSVIFFNELINESGFLANIREDEDYVDVLCKVKRLYDELKQLAATNKDYTLKKFVDDLKIYDEYGIDLKDNESNLILNKVKLSTVHKAKGLEYDYVFIPNCTNKNWGNRKVNEGIKIPLAFSGGNIYGSELEEERRLFFVALTRARKHVVISYSVFGTTKRSEKQTSQFIREIKPELVEFKKFDDKESIIRADEFILSNKSKFSVSQDSEDLVKDIVSQMQITITNINSYLKCPRCFFYKNVLRIPQLKTNAQSLGTAIHATLNYLQNYLNENSKLPTKEDLDSRFIYYLSKEFLSKEDFKQTEIKGKAIIDDFISENKNSFMQDSITEKNMSSYKIVWEGIPIGGKIDLIKFLPESKQNIEVVDFKTGKPKSSTQDYIRQLYFYKLLIDSVPQLKWNAVKGTITFLEKDRSTDNWVNRSYDLAVDDYESLKGTVKTVYGKILNLEFDECGEKCDNHELHDLNLKI